MLAKIDSDVFKRLERLAEMVYFLERFLQTWSTNVLEFLKAEHYESLPQATRDRQPYETFVPPANIIAETTFPSTAINLLKWKPSDGFTKATLSLRKSDPAKVCMYL
jgi:hypothetical protein